MKYLIYSIALLFCSSLFGQKDLSRLLKKFNNNTVPYIYVDHLKNETENIFVLDTRKHYEYEVSHIKNAIHVGYEKFDLKTTQQKIPNKNSKIVLYCSLGIRSEDIGEQLKKAGYTNVYNLYGGIFEWKNKDQVVYDSIENRTEKVHTFDKNWSKWLLKGEKIYE